MVKPAPAAFGALTERDLSKDWVDQLNERAQEIAQIDPNPDWEDIRQGTLVYMKRTEALVYLLAAASTFSVLRFLYEYGPVQWFTVAFVAFVYSDFKGGLTHIVLDEPKNISMPVIGPAALEFQMHHAIPQDNVIKPFVQMCGDLNLYALAVVALNCATTTMDVQSMAVMGFLVLFGYLGQWSHRCTHMQKKYRPLWVQKLQNIGLLLPAHNHAKHHQTYDGNFPILNGWTGPLCSVLADNIKSRWFWLATFAVFTCTDVGMITAAARFIAA